MNVLGKITCACCYVAIFRVLFDFMDFSGMLKPGGVIFETCEMGEIVDTGDNWNKLGKRQFVT